MIAEVDELILDNDEEGGADAPSTYLTFDLGGQTLGVEVRHVREILDQQKISRLPNAPPEMEGVIDVRGASVPILDIGHRLGMSPGEPGPDTRVIVFEMGVGAARRPFGVLADRVRDVDQIAPGEIEPSPRIGGGWRDNVMRGLSRRGAQLIALIDLDRVFPAEGTTGDAFGPF